MCCIDSLLILDENIVLKVFSDFNASLDRNASVLTIPLQILLLRSKLHFEVIPICEIIALVAFLMVVANLTNNLI